MARAEAKQNKSSSKSVTHQLKASGTKYSAINRIVLVAAPCSRYKEYPRLPVKLSSFPNEVDAERRMTLLEKIENRVKLETAVSPNKK